MTEATLGFWITSYHLYTSQHEFRYHTEAEAMLKKDEVLDAFKVLLGRGYDRYIEKFDVCVRYKERMTYKMPKAKEEAEI